MRIPWFMIIVTFIWFLIAATFDVVFTQSISAELALANVNGGHVEAAWMRTYNFIGNAAYWFGVLLVMVTVLFFIRKNRRINEI